MVKIKAFRGISYNPDKVKIEKNLFAPPYDVITSSYQNELYKRSTYNIVRLILGKQFDSDDEKENRYSRAARDYNDWLEKEVLVASDTPRLYFYIQKYKDSKGIDVTRKGFIARCYLEDFASKNVLPHEETMGGPKKDRLSLMQAAKTNFSQIFSIYSDPELIIDKTLEKASPDKPLVDVIDDDAVRHIFYEVSDSEAIDKVKSLMAERSVLIADGHHRYETALKYRDLQRAEDGSQVSEEKPYDYVMMYFANLDDTGLRVYPTHRLLKSGIGLSCGDLLAKIEPYFEVEKRSYAHLKEAISFIEEGNAKEMNIGLLSRDTSGFYYVLKPKFEKVLAQLIALGVPEILTKLDVTILHRLILEYFMGLDTIELKNQHNIEFVRDQDELVEKYNSEDTGLIFLVGTPDVATVKDICMSGFRMPQKTTYFYPKLLSGLVINPLS